MRRDSRNGAALIEALLSLVLLGTIGASLLILLGQTREAVRSARATEAATDSASAELERMVLLDRSALLDRVGWGIDHRLAVHLEQRSQSVFDVAISREPGLPPLLAASLYRPDSTGTR